ncbi:hypothetical protein D3C71_276600 [compost metagenome]
MSTLIERVYASAGPECIIDTIELTCDAWAESIYIVKGFDDMTLGLDGSVFKTFMAAPIAIALPKKNNQGSQSLNFAIDNVTGEAQRLIDQAIESEKRIRLTFRRYLDSDLTQPSENPFYATVLGGNVTGTTVQIEAGFQDILNMAWPRKLYTTEFAPGLAYL